MHKFASIEFQFNFIGSFDHKYMILIVFSDCYYYYYVIINNVHQVVSE